MTLPLIPAIILMLIEALIVSLVQKGPAMTETLALFLARLARANVEAVKAARLLRAKRLAALLVPVAPGDYFPVLTAEGGK